MDAAPISGFDPNDEAAWAVLGDWLTERGDPRGLLLALERSGQDPAQLEQLRRRHLHRYPELLVPVFGDAELDRHVELRWRAGLIIHARPLAPEPLAHAALVDRLQGLLASDAAVALAELRGNLIDPRALVDALVAGPPRATIRALTLGDYRTPMPDLARVWPRMPGLRELELLGPGVALGELATAVPRLVHLRLACELDPAPLRAFASSTFAKLRTLELRLGGDRHFGTSETDPSELFGPLLTGDSTPALEYLSITGIAFGDRLVAALTNCPLLERLRGLDLSDSRFEPHSHPLHTIARPNLRLRCRGSDISREQLEALHVSS